MTECERERKKGKESERKWKAEKCCSMWCSKCCSMCSSMCCSMCCSEDTCIANQNARTFSGSGLMISCKSSPALNTFLHPDVKISPFTCVGQCVSVCVRV